MPYLEVEDFYLIVSRESFQAAYHWPVVEVVVEEKLFIDLLQIEIRLKPGLLYFKSLEVRQELGADFPLSHLLNCVCYLSHFISSSFELDCVLVDKLEAFWILLRGELLKDLSDGFEGLYGLFALVDGSLDRLCFFEHLWNIWEDALALNLLLVLFNLGTSHAIKLVAWLVAFGG